MLLTIIYAKLLLKAYAVVYHVFTKTIHKSSNILITYWTVLLK